MSRSRRKRGDNPDDLLGSLGNNSVEAPGTEMSLSDITNEGYGSLVSDTFSTKGKTIRAKAISITEIYPDPTQPRRAIPSAVRHYWADGEPENVSYLLGMWQKEAEIERGSALDIQAYLDGDITDRAPEEIQESDQLAQIGSTPKSNPIEAAFLEIVALAQSIKRDGLTNPITISQNDHFYTIETGERRWLAYHLLTAHFGQKSNDWQKIPARIMDERSVWRQASENNARADLNAIGKARQFALLLMDLYGMENFQPFDAFEHEQDFYAQVADGNEWRIPRGAGEKLLTALGLSDPSQLRQYRALLRLAQSRWDEADDYDLTEGEIRKRVQEAPTVTPVTVSSAKTEQWNRRFQSLRKDLDSMSPKERDLMLSEIEDILSQYRN